MQLYKCFDLFLQFGLAMTGIIIVGMSIGICFSLASVCGFEYGPLHSILPFLLLGKIVKCNYKVSMTK